MNGRCDPFAYEIRKTKEILQFISKMSIRNLSIDYKKWFVRERENKLVEVETTK